MTDTTYSNYTISSYNYDLTIERVFGAALVDERERS
jgi:hypothetical protein